MKITILDDWSHGFQKLPCYARFRDHEVHVYHDTEKGIIVASPSRVGVGVSTAELTWALILASLRNIPHEVEQLKRGAWQTTMGTGLRSRILGIYALGGIGSILAYAAGAPVNVLNPEVLRR